MTPKTLQTHTEISCICEERLINRASFVELNSNIQSLTYAKQFFKSGQTVEVKGFGRIV